VLRVFCFFFFFVFELDVVVNVGYYTSSCKVFGPGFFLKNWAMTLLFSSNKISRKTVAILSGKKTLV